MAPKKRKYPDQKNTLFSGGFLRLTQNSIPKLNATSDAFKAPKKTPAAPPKVPRHGNAHMSPQVSNAQQGSLSGSARPIVQEVEVENMAAFVAPVATAAVMANLNDEQRQAANWSPRKPAMILAGAGTGKTTTLVARVRYLLSEGVYPGSILAITYTNKSAQELRERITAGREAESPVNVHTFHAWCYKVLRRRQYWHAAGYKTCPTIWDESKSKLVLKQAIMMSYADKMLQELCKILQLEGSSRWEDVIRAAQSTEKYQEVFEAGLCVALDRAGKDMKRKKQGDSEQEDESSDGENDEAKPSRSKRKAKTRAASPRKVAKTTVSSSHGGGGPAARRVPAAAKASPPGSQPISNFFTTQKRPSESMDISPPQPELLRLPSASGFDSSQGAVSSGGGVYNEHPDDAAEDIYSFTSSDDDCTPIPEGTYGSQSGPARPLGTHMSMHPGLKHIRASTKQKNSATRKEVKEDDDSTHCAHWVDKFLPRMNLVPGSVTYITKDLIALYICQEVGINILVAAGPDLSNQIVTSNVNTDEYRAKRREWFAQAFLLKPRNSKHKTGPSIRELVEACQRFISFQRCHSVPRDAIEDGEQKVAMMHYEKHMQMCNAIDFDGLLMVVDRSLASSDGARLLRNLRFQYQHLLIDEFQDCNEMQIKIIQQLQENRGQLTVVGDDAQAIYSFRGATNRAFKQLQDLWEVDEPLREFHLELNYRSIPSIVAVGNSIIANSMNSHLLANKKLTAVKASAQQVQHHYVGLEKEQAVLVTEHIQQLASEGVPFSSMACLFRCFQNKQIAGKTHAVLQKELLAAGIPYRMTRDKKLTDHIEIKNLLAIFAFLSNPFDDSALLHLLGTTLKVKQRLGQGFVDKLMTRQRSLSTVLPLWNIMAAMQKDLSVPAGHRSSISAFQHWHKRVHERVMWLTVPAALLFVLGESGIPEAVKKKHDTMASNQEQKQKPEKEEGDCNDEILANQNLKLLHQMSLKFHAEWRPSEGSSLDTHNLWVLQETGQPHAVPTEGGLFEPPTLQTLACHRLLKLPFPERMDAAEELAARAPQLVDDILGANRLGHWPLQDFVQSLTLDAPADNEAEENSGDTPEAVTISTVHAAKGLEWDAVFVCFWNQGLMPTEFSDKAYNISMVAGVLKPEPNESKEQAFGMFLQSNREEHEQEELRLCHVAVTRARLHLHICTVRISETMTNYLEPSSVKLPDKFNGTSVTTHTIHDPSNEYLTIKIDVDAKIEIARHNHAIRHGYYLRADDSDDDHPTNGDPDEGPEQQPGENDAFHPEAAQAAAVAAERAHVQRNNAAAAGPAMFENALQMLDRDARPRDRVRAQHVHLSPPREQSVVLPTGSPPSLASPHTTYSFRRGSVCRQIVHDLNADVHDVHDIPSGSGLHAIVDTGVEDRGIVGQRQLVARGQRADPSASTQFRAPKRKK